MILKSGLGNFQIFGLSGPKSETKQSTVTPFLPFSPINQLFFMNFHDSGNFCLQFDTFFMTACGILEILAF